VSGTLLVPLIVRSVVRTVVMWWGFLPEERG
jgi:hypothetical protein